MGLGQRPGGRPPWWRGHWMRVLALGWCLLGATLAARAGEPAEPPFLVLLVAAAHLDYGDQTRLIGQLHKRSQLKQGFMGHSWVYLEGSEGGRRQVYEAGLSPKGDGATQFIRGVLNLARYGYANPSGAQRENPRHEPNPIAYLWRDQGNGYLQPAAEAALRPTYAARLVLTQAQFRTIRTLMDPNRPEHRRFQLTGRQCSSFLADVAQVAGVRLEHEVTIEVPPQISVGGETYRLWTDPKYSRLTLSSPDVLEVSLKRLVAQGRATEALDWYPHRPRSASVPTAPTGKASQAGDPTGPAFSLGDL